MSQVGEWFFKFLDIKKWDTISSGGVLGSRSQPTELGPHELGLWSTVSILSRLS